MNLTVIEKNIIESLPVQQKHFVKARFSKRIKDFTDRDLESDLLDLVQITLAESGRADKSDKDVARFLKDTLFKDLKQPKFHNMTLDEIKLAFHNGVRLEYGEYFGINITTLHAWIKSFVEHQKDAMQEYNRKLLELEGCSPQNTTANPEGQAKVAEILKGVLKGVPDEIEKRKEKKPVVKSDRDLEIQRLFTEHYQTWLKKPYKFPRPEELNGMVINMDTSERYIDFEGKPVNEVEYVELKIKQFDEKQSA